MENGRQMISDDVTNCLRETLSDGEKSGVALSLTPAWRVTSPGDLQAGASVSAPPTR